MRGARSPAIKSASRGTASPQRTAGRGGAHAGRVERGHQPAEGAHACVRKRLGSPRRARICPQVTAPVLPAEATITSADESRERVDLARRG